MLGNAVAPRAAMILGLALVSCSSSPPTPGPIDEAKCRLVASFDADCDGVGDRYDRRPGIADYGDSDGDLIYNSIDEHPGVDDKTQDADGDYIPDYSDRFRRDHILDGCLDGLEAWIALGEGPSFDDYASGSGCGLDQAG